MKSSVYVNDVSSLILAKEGNREALEQVVTTNLGLVKSIALRFAGRGVELEDLIQIGTMGMMKAISGFDPSKECRFTTYAVPMIMGEIKRYLRSDGWIKVSRDTKACAAMIFRFAAEYEAKNGTAPTMDRICEELKLTREKAVFAMESARPALSLQQEDEETGFSPEKLVGEDPIEESIGKIALKEAIESLAPMEKQLILLRFFRSMTQEQTARILGISQVKVSREEKRILQKLREAFSSE